MNLPLFLLCFYLAFVVALLVWLAVAALILWRLGVWLKLMFDALEPFEPERFDYYESRYRTIENRWGWWWNLPLVPKEKRTHES